MQLWFRHGTEVSIREQLVTQIVVGILSGDLVSGQRLPSTRDLARRFHLHPTLISAAYRQLERERWVELLHGSGVYVRETKPQRQLSPALAVDEMLRNYFVRRVKLGVPLASLRARISRWLDLQPPDHFLLIEPDEELRNIVASELRRAVTLPVKATDSVNDDLREFARGVIAVTLRSETRATARHRGASIYIGRFDILIRGLRRRIELRWIGQFHWAHRRLTLPSPIT